MCGRLSDMRPLPFPLRVAAGVAVTTAERMKDLPKQLTEFPITVASQVLQTSMRVQQEVTELAVKGDDALSFLQSTEEAPGWATFDEDLDDRDLDDEAHTADTPAPPPPDRNGQRPNSASPGTGDTNRDDHPWAQEERALSAWQDGQFDTPDRSTDVTSQAPDTTLPATEIVPPADEQGTGTNSVFPGGLADYDQLSLPQVRAQLRERSLAELEELLAYERSNANRPSFIGMISRRIDNVRRQADTDRGGGPDEQ